MRFEVHTDVILTSDVEEHHLRAGDVGTVVERHNVLMTPAPRPMKRCATSHAATLYHAFTNVSFTRRDLRK